MKRKSDPARRARPRGEVTAALILSAGVAIERARGPRSGWTAAIPIVFVNYVAFRAQLRFWEDHLDRGDALLVSAALESVAVYLAWQAHRALLKNDSALRLRLAAYGWAAGMGVLNYSHYMKPGWRPTAAAVVFGLMSAVSPWLWSVHSRRESRDELKARELIEDHSVRLGFTRWFWYPLRSAMVQRRSAWVGENRPAVAIALYEQRRAARKAAKTGDRGGVQVRTAKRTPEPAGAPASAVPAPAAATRAATQTPPPAHSPHPEPLPRRVGAAGARELAAVSAGEQAIVLRLVQAGKPLPGINKLSRRERIGAPKARRILVAARSQMNGHEHG